MNLERGGGGGGRVKRGRCTVEAATAGGVLSFDQLLTAIWGSFDACKLNVGLPGGGKN